MPKPSQTLVCTLLLVGALAVAAGATMTDRIRRAKNDGAAACVACAVGTILSLGFLPSLDRLQGGPPGLRPSAAKLSPDHESEPAGARRATLDELRKGFATPPREAGPWVYWMFFENVMSKEEITRELEEMAAAGIAGAELRFLSLYGFSGRARPVVRSGGLGPAGPAAAGVPLARVRRHAGARLCRGPAAGPAAGHQHGHGLAAGRSVDHRRTPLEAPRGKLVRRRRAASIARRAGHANPARSAGSRLAARWRSARQHGRCVRVLSRLERHVSHSRTRWSGTSPTAVG